ncbi:MAG TPA: hypothetical protein VJT31_02270 [Rugosimonospora sp.]|nr:hypothetical protein [Rugosimonospora sp.]
MPPQKHTGRTVLIVSAAALAAILVVGAILIGARAGTNTAKSGTGTGSTTGGVTLSTPDQIGSLRLATDQTRANDMRSTMSNIGLENPYAVIYQDTTVTGRTTVVWGGTGSMMARSNRSAEMSGFMTAAVRSMGGNVGNTIDVTPAPLNGVARCADVSGTGIRFALCVWSGYDALLGVLTGGITAQQAAQQLSTLIPAVAQVH